MASQEIPQPHSNPIGSRTPPRNLEAFQTLCQSIGITPVWEAFDVQGNIPNVSAFGARVRFRGRDVEDQGPHPSKQAAKNAAAEKALVRLRELIAAEGWGDMSGRWNGRGNGDGNGNRDGGGREGSPSTTVTGNENWVGALQEICQARRWSLPEYKFFQKEAQFFCEAKLADLPNQVFGDKSSTPFTKKKDAQKNAAKEAVLWMQNRAAREPSDPNDRTDPPSYTEAARESTPPTSPGRSPPHQSTSYPPDSAIPAEDNPSAQGSYASQVPTLCHKLGFRPPSYKTEPSTGGIPGAYARVYAVFDHPMLKDCVFEIKNVYGMKKAREECAKLILEHLKMIEADREAFHRNFMAGRANVNAESFERPMERL